MGEFGTQNIPSRSAPTKQTAPKKAKVAQFASMLILRAWSNEISRIVPNDIALPPLMQEEFDYFVLGIFGFSIINAVVVL